MQAVNREMQAVDFSFVLAASVHDMKNSLGMLLNTLAEVMAQYPAQNEAQANSYGVLEYEAARINSELIQLLSLYRLDSDHVPVHIDECLVLDLLSEQIARNRGLLQARNLDLTLECQESLLGYFDSDLVGGVINNVLVNCARYSRKQLILSARQTSEGLCIALEDDGPGYPKAMLNAFAAESSFTSFAFADNRPHLGLLFAHKVALLHKHQHQQGFIRLTNNSSLGGGCFQLVLP
jgi:signal transduction histidine kinase